MKGSAAGARALLKGGADVNAKAPNGLTPLHVAAGNGRAEVVKVLLKGGAEIEAKDRKHWKTPLHWAVFGGGVAAARALLDAGSDVNAKDARGQTPLRAARFRLNAPGSNKAPFQRIIEVLKARGAKE